MKEFRQKDYFAPVRVLAYENVGHARSMCRRLAEEERPQASLYPSEEMLTVSGRGFVLFDFGRENHGGIRLLTYRAKGFARIRFGESASEACAEIGERGCGNDHALRDFRVELESFSDSEYGCTGYQFVRMDFEEGAEAELTGVFGSCIYRQIERIGSFACDDERIERIWQTAARTLHLNMQNMLWDGIKRDRLVWVGDMYPEMLALTDLFGKDECILEALEFVRKNTKSEWINGIPAYSAWWVLTLAEYSMRTGDFDYARAHVGAVSDIFEKFRSRVVDGALDFGDDDMANYFDWPTHGRADEKAGVHALVRFAAMRASSLYAELGADGSAAENLFAALDACGTRAPESAFKQVTAMQYFAGMNPARAAETLSEGGAKGLSCFQSYFILRATAETAGAERATEMLRDYFGGMLDMGATTFWEDFDLEWTKDACPIDRLPKEGERDVHGDFGRFCYRGFRHSLCHGWSAGVLSFLTEVIVGVRRLGTHEVELSPRLCGLRRVHACVPLADGVLEVECTPNEVRVIRSPSGTVLRSNGVPLKAHGGAKN